jgi:acyl phosphate:glycerol-3-phosphate acyltransferase
MMDLIALVIAFVVGGIPSGYLLVRWKTGEDVRQKGSGNIGATNVLRTTGRAVAVATLLLDIAKGVFAVWVADKLSDGSPVWMSLAALAVMAGHAYPIFLKFQGGKAVASFIGAFLYLTPIPMLAALILFVIVVAVTRQISMGSIVAAGSLPLATWLIEHPPSIVILSTLAAALFLIYRHRPNIERIRGGTENVFRFGSPR